MDKRSFPLDLVLEIIEMFWLENLYELSASIKQPRWKLTTEIIKAW